MCDEASKHGIQSKLTAFFPQVFEFIAVFDTARAVRLTAADVSTLLCIASFFPFLMSKNILVTGGAGYIGSHTVRLLTQQGHKVVVLDNLVHGHKQSLVEPETIFVDGNVGDREVLDRVFSEHQIDAVVHFAAYTAVGESVREPLRYYRNNVVEPLTLLEAMEAHECRVIVFSSTAAVYGEPVFMPITEDHPKNPINPYGKSKWFTENIIRDCDTAWGLKSACLRYFNASGCSSDGLIGEDHTPETHLIPLVLMAVTGERDKISVFGDDYDTPDGTCIRDYIHVEDLASAHSRALDALMAGGESMELNLGTGNGCSVKEIIDAAEKITGKDVPHDFVERRAGDPAKLIADPSRAEEAIGWKAQNTDAYAMVESAWKWINGERGGRFSK